MGYAIFTLVILVAAAFGVWRFLRSAGQLLVVRFVDALLPFSIAAVLLLTIGKITEGPRNPWNDCKLAPVVAMTRGYSLYQDPQTGVMTGWIYGPVGALVLLPSALASDPTGCVIIGIIISAICYLLPLVWLFLQQADPKARLLVVPSLVLIGWLTGTHEDLARCAVIASPDAPALLFGGIACALLLRKRTLLMMALSALGAVLCCWTKQNFLSILFALIAWVAIVDGWRKALIYAGMIVGIGGLVSAVLIPSFGASNMYFHMIALPASHPWQNGDRNRAVYFFGAFLELIGDCSPSLLAIGIVMILDGGLNHYAAKSTNADIPRKLNLRRWIASRGCMLPLLVAVALIPTSLLGYVKVGGFVNNLACTHYFLMAAAAIYLIDVVSRAAYILHGAPLIVSSIVTLCGAAIGFQTLLIPYHLVADHWQIICRTYDNPQQEVYQYALKHPGEVYCPWNNLTTLYADGKLYHFEWGLLDRFYAKKMPSIKQFYDHLPEHINMVVYTAPPQSIACQNGLGNYQRTVTVPEMKDCIVVVK